MKRHQDRVVIELEHVADPQGPADVARAYALLRRLGDKVRHDGVRQPAPAISRPERTGRR